MKTSLYNTQLTANASGASNSILLPNGQWNLFVTSNDWTGGQSARLQISSDNVNWMNSKKSGSNVTFTENSGEQSNGGLYARLYVDTYTAEITLIGKKFD